MLPKPKTQTQNRTVRPLQMAYNRFIAKSVKDQVQNLVDYKFKNNAFGSGYGDAYRIEDFHRDLILAAHMGISFDVDVVVRYRVIFYFRGYEL